MVYTRQRLCLTTVLGETATRLKERHQPGLIGLTIAACYGPSGVCRLLNLKGCIISELSQATSHDSNKTAAD